MIASLFYQLSVNSHGDQLVSQAIKAFSTIYNRECLWPRKISLLSYFCGNLITAICLSVAHPISPLLFATPSCDYVRVFLFFSSGDNKVMTITISSDLREVEILGTI